MNYPISRRTVFRSFGISIIACAIGFGLVSMSVYAQSRKIESKSKGDKKMTLTTARQKTNEQSSGENDIRPFRINFPEAELTELRRRIKATRWSSRELVEDRSQGVQLATLRELA